MCLNLNDLVKVIKCNFNSENNKFRSQILYNVFLRILCFSCFKFLL